MSRYQSKASSSEFLPEDYSDPLQPSTSSATSSQSDPSDHPALPISQVGAINRAAQLHGTLIGVPTAIVLHMASGRFNLKGQTRTLTALLGGSVTAYVYSKYALHRDLTSLENSVRILERQKKAKMGLSEADELDLKSSQELAFEAGVGGLHGLEDRYSTSRGDH